MVSSSADGFVINDIESVLDPSYPTPLLNATARLPGPGATALPGIAALN